MFYVKVWGVYCVIGLDSLVSAVFIPTPPHTLSAGPGVVPSVYLLTFFFSVLPTPSTQRWARVWGIGPLN